MTERCWEELRLAGQAITEGLDLSLAVKGLSLPFRPAAIARGRGCARVPRWAARQHRGGGYVAAEASLAEAAE